MKREHDSRAWLAWHIAQASAYPPAKPRDFPPLRRFLWGKRPKPKPVDWQASFAAFSAWVQGAKR